MYKISCLSLFILVTLIPGICGFSQAAEYKIKAGAYYSPIHMNIGEKLLFELADGQVREIIILRKDVDCYTEFGHRQWTIWADVQVDGQEVHLSYSPFRMKALYEPMTINGMRIGLDKVRGLTEATSYRYTAGYYDCKKDLLIWVNDAMMPLIPNCHLWFDLFQDRDETIPQSYDLITEWPRNRDYRIRQDRDIHPSTYDLNSSPKNNSPEEPLYKTGWLGVWPYAGPQFHSGIDFQMPVGTNLYTVTDHCTQEDVIDKTYNGISYACYSPDQVKWSFANYHCTVQVGSNSSILQSVDVCAISGKKGAWIPNNHTYIEYDRNFVMSPWPVIWQGIENKIKTDGFIHAEISPVYQAGIGENVHFNSSDSRPSANREIVSYSWYFDDGTTSREQNPVKLFGIPGLHRAILIIGDGILQYLAETFITVGTVLPYHAPFINLEPYIDSKSEPAPMLPHIFSEVTYSVKAEGYGNNDLSYR